MLGKIESGRRSGQQRKPETKMKRLPPDWEKISANDVTNKGFISRIHKQLPQFNIKKQITQIKNGQKI